MMYFRIDSRNLPHVRLAGQAAIEPPSVHRKRVPHEWIIYLIKKGEMLLEEDGTRYRLMPGDFLLLEPEKCHEGKRAAYCEYFYIHFQHTDIRMVSSDEVKMLEEMHKLRGEAQISDSCSAMSDRGYGLLLPKYCHTTDETACACLLQSLHEMILCNCEHMEYYKTLCGCQLLQFLVRVSRNCLSKELEKSGTVTARGYQKVLEVRSYLQACYQEPMSGDMLAKKFDMSFDYLNRLFRLYTGRPIFQYLNSLRIAHARELLTTTSMRIAQISERVGFADESYFSKVFKKQTGVCPADYARAFYNNHADFKTMTPK